MKRPLVLWIAPPLMLLSGISTIYLAINRFAAVRLRNSVIFGIICVACALLLYFKPRLGRWPAAVYYLLVTMEGVNEVAKITEASRSTPAWIAVYWWGNMFLGFLLFYTLIGGKSMKAFLNAEKASKQSTDVPTLPHDRSGFGR